MAALTTTIAAVVAAASYYQGEESRREAKSAAGAAAAQQRNAQAEQKAVNASQAAAERRRQVREERIRRARILQSSQNTGTVGSSGETGGIASLSTQLGSNMGFNAGMQQKSVAISDFNQRAADFSFQSQQSMADSESFRSLGGLALNIFSASGGFQKTPATTTPKPNIVNYDSVIQ